jgi:hypothetical protein
MPPDGGPPGPIGKSSRGPLALAGDIAPPLEAGKPPGEPALPIPLLSPEPAELLTLLGLRFPSAEPGVGWLML